MFYCVKAGCVIQKFRDLLSRRAFGVMPNQRDTDREKALGAE
jgi:hypothetical protein